MSPEPPITSPHGAGQVAHPAEHGHPVAGAFALLLEDGVGGARGAGVEHEGASFEFVENFGTAGDRLDVDGVVGMKADVVEPAEGGGVLVLPADGLAQDVDLDLARLACDALGADDLPLEGIKRLEQSAGERTGGAHAGAGGQVADGGDLDIAIEAGHAEGFANDGVLDVVDRLGDFGFGVADADRFFESMAHGDVHMFFDGHAEHRARFVAVEGG